MTEPTDAELDMLIDDVAGLDSSNEAFRKFARAVLAKWGTPQPVVREPLTADDLRMPKDGQQWRVEWWNESCRMLLPANKKLDSFQAYKTGTLMFTIKERGITQKGGQHGAE